MVVMFRFCSFLRLNPPVSPKLLWFSPICAVKCKVHLLQNQSVLFSTNPNSKQNSNKNEGKHSVRLLAVGLLTSSIAAYLVKEKVAYAKKHENIVAGKRIAHLPVYTEEEVAKHKTKETRIWLTYKHGVYDVTDFVEHHPGGNKILLAAGSSIEPFWALYAVHHTNEIYHMLESYRIGNIEIVEKSEEDVRSMDPYAHDPKRNPLLRPASLKPYNAEPPPSLLVDYFTTPNPIFFTRNHLPVPNVDASKYRLHVSGIGIKAKTLSLDDIKNFPKHTITATLQCAGNRRSEMSKVKKVKGLNWDHAAIGNATWTGARLTDVLRHCGLDLHQNHVQHVQFEGLDEGAENNCYGASIPAHKAFDPNGDVLLVYEMNGEPLSRDHGFPLRVIVPGVVGARNVKWLSRIILSDEESDSHWQQNDYKGFSPSIDWDTVDFKSAPAIQELPVISAICMPEEGETVEVMGGSIICKGYAWSGGGKKIIRVDVSSDKGKTWHVADLEQKKDKPPRHWSWSLWSIALPIPKGADHVEIWAKAVDSSYNTQPETVHSIWNIRGLLNNAYHKITVKIAKS